MFGSPLARSLFSGDYKSVLRATLDSPDGSCAPAEIPLAVGALVFSGRQDEALSLHRWWAKNGDEDPVVGTANHFFLAIGECRTGRYGEALAFCRAAARAARRGDALQGFFVHQAIGLLRHFTGRVRSAVRHASLARRLAVEAQFPYGRMLALDLLGHALVLQGQVHAGFAVLDLSAELAESLGLAQNAGAPRTAIAAYRARYLVPSAQPKRELEARVAELRPEDGYARRMVLSELATQHALAGDASTAARILDEASVLALPDGDRRAQIRKLAAECVVVGAARGRDAVREKVAAARALLDPDLDDALDIELLWSQALACGLRAFDEDADARRRAQALAKRTGSARAIFLAAAPHERAGLDLLGDDRMAAMLDVVARDPEEARNRIVTQELWGLLPRLYGHEPGRRVHLLHDVALLVVEDMGDVAPADMPGAVLVALLRALERGPVTKQTLVETVWRMKVYRPERHDALVFTAVRRLRAALGPHGSWIRVTDQGYSLAEGVVVHEDRSLDPSAEGPSISPAAVSLPPSTLAASGGSPPGLAAEAPGSAPPSSNLGPSPSSSRKPTAERHAAVLGALAREGPLSTSEIAKLLKISEMTAFRLMSAMVQEGVVSRSGLGKRTRYTRNLP